MASSLCNNEISSIFNEDQLAGTAATAHGGMDGWMDGDDDDEAEVRI